MEQLEENLRTIEIDGLTWGASKLVPLAFGIKKLQINLVVEDEKVSIDDLQQQIESDEDHVQSTDVVSHILRLLARDPTNRPTREGCYAEVVDGLRQTSGIRIGVCSKIMQAMPVFNAADLAIP